MAEERDNHDFPSNAASLVLLVLMSKELVENH